VFLYNWASEESRFYRDQNDQVGHGSTLSPISARGPPKLGLGQGCARAAFIACDGFGGSEETGLQESLEKITKIDGLATDKIPGRGPVVNFRGAIKRVEGSGVSRFHRGKRLRLTQPVRHEMEPTTHHTFQRQRAGAQARNEHPGSPLMSIPTPDRI
jgi:hypothetical protein